MTRPVPPEIPPFGPDIPKPESPEPSPPWPPQVLDDAAVDARTALLRQRRVLLVGALDETTATRVTAERAQPAA